MRPGTVAAGDAADVVGASDSDSEAACREVVLLSTADSGQDSESLDRPEVFVSPCPGPLSTWLSRRSGSSADPSVRAGPTALDAGAEAGTVPRLLEHSYRPDDSG